MKTASIGLLLFVTFSVALSGQERDRSLERISLAMRQPQPAFRFIDPAVEPPAPTTFGIFTLMPPTGRGEMIRVSVPVGALIMRAVRGVVAANHRRQETAARRRVEAELEWLELHAIGFNTNRP